MAALGSDNNNVAGVDQSPSHSLTVGVTDRSMLSLASTPDKHRPSSDLVSSSVLSEPISSGQLQVQVWVHLIPNDSDHAACRRISSAPLNDIVLDWCLLWKKKKPQRRAEWVTHCLICLCFTVMQIMCLDSLICLCEQQMFVNTLSGSTHRWVSEYQQWSF